MKTNYQDLHLIELSIEILIGGRYSISKQE